MGKHNKVSQMDELLAQVDADARPVTINRTTTPRPSMIHVDEFIEKFSSYLRDTIHSAYGEDTDFHMEDAAAHTWSAAENFYYSVTNFPR
jgi:hypothetical protein